METAGFTPECQIHGLEPMSEPLGRIESTWQLRNRIRRIIKRRLNYTLNWFSEITRRRRTNPTAVVNAADGGLQAGDEVRVKSQEEIQATLDRWSRLKGCDFMEEMWAYCGTSQRVLKRVDKFLDERTYRIRKCRGILTLEGAMCGGTRDLGTCDRCCLFFWREEWLEKS